MSAQDDMLDELGNGISRLHDQAQLINDESRLHVKLLDDMEGGVEAATMGLRAEAKHAEKIREQSSVCKVRRRINQAHPTARRFNLLTH